MWGRNSGGNTLEETHTWGRNIELFVALSIMSSCSGGGNVERGSRYVTKQWEKAIPYHHKSENFESCICDTKRNALLLLY